MVFFAAVNPMHKNHKDPQELGWTKPRLAWYKQKTWKRHQDTVCWVDLQLAQRKGLKFYQTRSNAILFCDIPKATTMGNGEIRCGKVYASTRLPPKISFKDTWMKELDSEVAGSSKDTQRIQPKSKNPVITNGETRGWATVHPGDRTRCLVWSRSTNYSTRTGRPVDGPKSIKSCVAVSVELVDKYEDQDENVDADQTRMVRPVGGQQFTQLEEIDIDFRVPGLSHAVVKEAENCRVQELVKKIESHPHR